jgi:hypothetical protein
MLERERRRLTGLMVIMLLFASNCFAVTNWDLQQVGPDGFPVQGCYAYDYNSASIEGIILNKPEQMMDVNEEWQIFVQGNTGAHAGTAIYMRKNNFSPGQIYSEQQWADELYRIGHDPNGNYEFQPGDRVRVTGFIMFYRGKANINEWHSIDPNNNFVIDLIDPAAGLPQPKPITLAMVKDANNNFIFDYTRAIGCERYQGMLVRVNDVNIISGNWQPDGHLVIGDNNGHVFDVNLGFGPGFTKYPMPTGTIDVVGIFDQEAPGEYPYFDFKAGYRLWVMNYDGNGSVLTDNCGLNGYFAGDINRDCIVNFADFAELASDWLKCSNLSFDDCTTP